MKKHQDKRDILKGFYDYLKSNDIKITLTNDIIV